MLKKLRLLLKAFARACVYRFFLCRSKQELLLLYSASTKDPYGNISALAHECDKRHVPYVTLSYEDMRSRMYASLALLARARVLVIDANSPAAFVRLSEKTILVNCWHACGAYKKMAFDAKQKGKDERSEEQRIARIHRCISYFICSSPYTAAVCRQAFRLRADQVLPLGTPRTDALLALAKEAGTPEAVTILYAPTFRTRAAARVLPEPLPNARRLKAFVEERGIRVAHFGIRMHPSLAGYGAVDAHANISRVEAAGWEDWSERPYLEALSSASLLITDYSSVFFDYLFFNRPVLFYVPDLDAYQNNERELYVSPYSLFPDACAASEEELGRKLRAHLAPDSSADGQAGNAGDGTSAARFASCAAHVRNTYTASCDGHSCERIVALLQSLLRGNS